MSEVYFGVKLFDGRQSVEVFADVIKVLGTPNPHDLLAMRVPLKGLKMP
jgi:hypothetical protein